MSYPTLKNTHDITFHNLCADLQRAAFALASHNPETLFVNTYDETSDVFVIKLRQTEFIHYLAATVQKLQDGIKIVV